MTKKPRFSNMLGKIPAIITILAAVIADILAYFNVLKFSMGEEVLLVLITLVAIDALTERINILEKIKDAIDQLPQNIANPTVQYVFHSELNPFEMPGFDEATDLSMSAVSFNFTAVSTSQKISKLLDKGCKVRILIMDPSAPGIAHPTPENVPNLTKSAELFLKSNKNRYTNFEVRSFNYSPPFGVVMVDREDPLGFLVVTTYSYKTESRDRPRFILKSKDNDPWYEFFQKQFEMMWLDAIPWTEPT